MTDQERIGMALRLKRNFGHISEAKDKSIATGKHTYC